MDNPWFPVRKLICEWYGFVGFSTSMLVYRMVLGGELPTNRGCGLVHPSDFSGLTLQKSHVNHWGYNPLTKWDEPPSSGEWKDWYMCERRQLLWYHIWGEANMGFKTRIGRYLGQPSQQLRMKTVDRTGCRNGLTEWLILRHQHVFFHGLY